MRVASAALVLVFAGLLAAMSVGSMIVKKAARETTAAITLSQRYEFIERQLWKEASLVRVHGENWQGADWYANVYQEHDAVLAIEETLREIAAGGNDADARLAARVGADHDRYTVILRQLFSEVDANDAHASATYQRSIRLFDAMRTQVDRRAQQQYAVAARSLVELDATQTRVSEAMLMAALAGGILVMASAWIIVSYRRVIERNQQAEIARLATASLTDMLTGLGNHRAYQDELTCEIARLERHGGVLSLALVDVDDFKTINDRKGHVYGDQVLATLGSLLRSLRKSDRAYRLGGDEFAVILPHTDSGEAHLTMDRLRGTVESALGGATVSIGIATSRDVHGVDAVALRAQGDAALYAVKQRGRNAVLTYGEARSHEYVRALEQESALRQLLKDRKIDVVFQPIWDIGRQAPLGYEALVRPAPGYGFGGPQQLFDLAEHMGLAPELDRLSLEAIFARASDVPADALLFVNVVPQTLGSDALANDVLTHLVQRAGLTPARVVIELTERSMTNFDTIVREARRLQRDGFRLALDDAGAGNAGLDVLRHLCVDYVKIDRSVVVEAMDDPIARAIVVGIVGIAKAMGSYVIAEGIETSDALAFIRRDISPGAGDIGIAGVQGYLLGRPHAEPWKTAYGSAALALAGNSSDARIMRCARAAGGR